MPDPEALLEEQVTSAWRPRTVDGTLRAHPAWHDLAPEGRRRAYEATLRQRRLEAALDPDGLTTTGRAVLARLSRRT